MSAKLSRREKWAYGSGDLSFSLITTIIGAYFAIFLTDVVGMPAGVAALAIFIGGTWDYLNDPLVGHISDRARTRWGRRRPFLLFGAIPLVLIFSLMWWRPPIEGAFALGAYFTVIYLLYEIAATFVYMPYFALTPELTSDYDERTSLVTIRAFFSIFGSLVAFTVPLMIVGGFHPENAGRVLVMGAVFGAVSLVPLWLVFFGTRERIHEPAPAGNPPVDPVGAQQPAVHLRTGDLPLHLGGGGDHPADHALLHQTRRPHGGAE
jgi:GPH family glycoside/pentoside/hexuronide:cation symporter